MKRGRLFVKCQISEEDSFSLLENLHKKGIYTFDITFFEQKAVFSVDFADCKKLFAISRNMCYNISILKYYGKVSLIKKAFSKVGLLTCSIALLVCMVAFDGYVSSIKYLGDGEYFATQITEFLKKEGIEERSFLKADLRSVENKLIQSVDGISYVSLSKKGRILTVEAYRAEDEIHAIDLKKPKITANASGTVTAINLLSGTACVNVGDSVRVGDVLIDGYFLKGEEKIDTYALGEVEIEVEYVYSYQSFARGERYLNRACVLARESLGEKDVIRQTVSEKTEKGKTVYTVTLYYLVIAS
ncbi:MAG: sporulation protein YqfD [Clostridia bacterium]|nr:sporulation protein YqfD [Clostridia bacterium]